MLKRSIMASMINATCIDFLPGAPENLLMQTNNKVITSGNKGGNIFMLSQNRPSNNNMTDLWPPQRGHEIPNTCL